MQRVNERASCLNVKLEIVVLHDLISICVFLDKYLTMYMCMVMMNPRGKGKKDLQAQSQ
jgi:hypothetical protein